MLTIEEIHKEIKRERDLFIKYHALHQKRLSQLKQKLKHAKRNNLRTIGENAPVRVQD